MCVCACVCVCKLKVDFLSACSTFITLMFNIKTSNTFMQKFLKTSVSPSAVNPGVMSL